MASKGDLIYVPVMHTSCETGLILGSINGHIPINYSGKFSSEYHRSIEKMWKGIDRKICKYISDYKRVHIYQDALPVCGTEAAITGRLAEMGSDNHKLLLKLIRKGATLEGTEEPDLLIKEYDLLNSLFRQLAEGETDKDETVNAYKVQSARITKKRDKYIASRIRDTLKPGDLPLVFMGILHHLEKVLEKSFNIEYIIYSLPLRSLNGALTTTR